jgi:hypothetical protein
MVYELHLPLHVRTRVHEAGHVALGHEVNYLIPLVGRFHRGILFRLYPWPAGPTPGQSP